MTKPRRKPGPKGPVRPQVAVRLSDADRAHIDNMAAARGIKRSEMVRIMLAYATAKMPDDWTP